MAEDYAVKYELLHVEKHTGARLGKLQRLMVK
ncbi:Uncharacterised protein [Weissella viridescens]|uniref:Uncharacterized protein n=1 Tax=Weissella viridescens TaxID=1629 RepID=A0A380P1Q0_WEIVI|nr:Uncharacterised protein [Weissella viridescens]